MKIRFVLSLIAVVAVPVVFVLLVAPHFSSRVEAALTHNRLATNRLATNRLATNRLATNRLATNRLATNGLAADMTTAGELLATADGRDLYAYMMSCALPDGTNIQADIPGAPDSCPECAPPNDTPYTCQSEVCVFPGSLGLAPKWIDHKLNKKGQRWISACLFARVNLFTQAEGISLRGKHDALAASIGEREEFPVEEGAFYGQLFTKEDEPIQWFACMGEGQAQGDTGGLAIRDCTEPDPGDPTHTKCGFNYAGECGAYEFSSSSDYACATRKDGYYEKCHERPGPGKWPKTKKYKEVISAFVAGG